MPQQRDLPESMAWRVKGRLESGETQRSVADAVGVARSVVARLWNRFKKQEMLDVDQGQLQRQLLLATGRRVSSQTVRNRLHEGGLYARRPMVCIPLTPGQRAARRRWAAEHRDWEQHDWSQVLLTDESRFSLECHNKEELVGWYGGGISLGGRTDLHIIRNGTLTGRRYADEILRPHVIPYTGAIGDSFVFQDDNARPYSARLVESMLEAETIQRMELPACTLT
ncbi:transposable element Tcb2 transposase [Trichonephila clavipes]|uniref:Transposable element Tcb2 transposase n=1 Tax=Trichonephila clavipes TaxID=2585209 RepID=A0A8X6V520_TRICX|nr:transposable element Tcb2 transposase [Trichonephila clavipes]